MSRLLSLLCALAVVGFATEASARVLRVAVGGEPAATALMVALAPRIAEATGAEIMVTAQGDAEAAAALRDCRVDLAMMPSAEMMAGFEAEGFFQAPPRPAFATDHVLVGPRRDPANAGASSSVARAFKAIAEKRSRFVSIESAASARRLEQSLWNRAGVDPRLGRGDWYSVVRDGGAAAAALRGGAYALLTRADWLSLGGAAAAAVVIEGRPELAVVQQAAAVRPWRCRGAGGSAATAVLDWLTGPEGAAAVADWRIGSGAPFAPAR
jgi:tungstate transport system substrate-binding protein